MQRLFDRRCFWKQFIAFHATTACEDFSNQHDALWLHEKRFLHYAKTLLKLLTTVYMAFLNDFNASCSNSFGLHIIGHVSR